MLRSIDRVLLPVSPQEVAGMMSTPNSPNSDLVQSMNELAKSIGSARGLSDTLQTLTQTAVQTIPGVDHASISVVDARGWIESLVPTDHVVADADRRQSDLGQGPCLDAALGAQVVRSDDLLNDDRWPKYAPEAAAMGIGSQLALHLFTDNQACGGLNLYFNQPGSITDETVELAELFAGHAAIAMGHVREVERLTQALGTCRAIGKAIGIIMERYELDDERAFEFLIRVSQTGNLKLRIVADEVVREANQKVQPTTEPQGRPSQPTGW